MTTDSTRYRKWKMAAPADNFTDYFDAHPQHTKYIPQYENDVTADPFRHRHPGRITEVEKEIARYRKGCYRWKNNQVRIVFFPDKTNATIYSLDANTPAQIKYKKRSK